MKLSIYPSSVETARALIHHLVELLNAEPKKTFNIAVSGGSTPALLFDLWANDYVDITPWQRIKFFWVDERCVPPEDSESNYGMMHSLLLSSVPIPYENIFRIRGEEQPNKEALRYSELVCKHVPLKDGLPEFDVVLLGAGEDGHTSSIFSGQEALLSSKLIYVTSIHPGNGQKRIAMTGLPILAARHIIFLVTGKSKADVVSEMCHSGDTGPAAYIAHHSSNVELYMDATAAVNVRKNKL